MLMRSLLKRPFFGRYQRPWTWPADIRKDDWSRVEFPNKSGARLVGLLARARGGVAKGIVVLAHPMAAEAKGWGLTSGHADMLREGGYDVLAFDFNGFGESEDGGFEFPTDIHFAGNFAKGLLPGRPVVLFGISMGAGYGVCAMDSDESPFRVAVIESAFTSLEEFWRRYPLPYYVLRGMSLIMPGLARSLRPDRTDQRSAQFALAPARLRRQGSCDAARDGRALASRQFATRRSHRTVGGTGGASLGEYGDRACGISGTRARFSRPCLRGRELTTMNRMFQGDPVVELVNAHGPDPFRAARERLALLVQRGMLIAEVPLERILAAVKEEIVDLSATVRGSLARAAVRDPAARDWYTRAFASLDVGTCVFPRATIEHLLAEVPAELGDLRSLLEQGCARHRDLERRVASMMRPPGPDEIAGLDPLRDAAIVHHSVGWSFRTERVFFGTLEEIRPLIAAPANLFFFASGEFSVRTHKRLVDTVLLFDNIGEWGAESRRGREAAARINAIHGRYNVPNDAFRWVLLNLIFVPVEWNSKLGWRPFTELERLGWFHHYIAIGRGMNIADLSDDYDEMFAWWKDASAAAAQPSEITRSSFEKLTAQLIEYLPEDLRALCLDALLAGMHDSFRRAVGYPAHPISWSPLSAKRSKSPAYSALPSPEHRGSAVCSRTPCIRTARASTSSVYIVAASPSLGPRGTRMARHPTFKGPMPGTHAGFDPIQDVDEVEEVNLPRSAGPR